MNTLLVRICVTLLATITLSQTAFSQKATEVYIPIGDSPGISKSETMFGTIDRLNYEARSMELVVESGNKTILLSEKTIYYIDRSTYRKKSETGDMRDCKVGLLIEVRAADDGTAEWVKIKSE